MPFTAEKYLHAGTGAGGEVKIIAAVGPGRHLRVHGLAQSGDVDPQQALNGRIPRRMPGLDGHHTVVRRSPRNLGGVVERDAQYQWWPH